MHTRPSARVSRIVRARRDAGPAHARRGRQRRFASRTICASLSRTFDASAASSGVSERRLGGIRCGSMPSRPIARHADRGEACGQPRNHDRAPGAGALPVRQSRADRRSAEDRGVDRAKRQRRIDDLAPSRRPVRIDRCKTHHAVEHSCGVRRKVTILVTRDDSGEPERYLRRASPRSYRQYECRRFRPRPALLGTSLCRGSNTDRCFPLAASSRSSREHRSALIRKQQSGESRREGAAPFENANALQRKKVPTWTRSLLLSTALSGDHRLTEFRAQDR